MLFNFLKNFNFFYTNFFFLKNFNLIHYIFLNKNNVLNINITKNNSTIYFNFFKNNLYKNYLNYFNYISIRRGKPDENNLSNFFGVKKNIFFHIGDYSFNFIKLFFNNLYSLVINNLNFTFLDFSYKHYLSFFNYLFTKKNLFLYKNYFFVSNKYFNQRN